MITKKQLTMKTIEQQYGTFVSQFDWTLYSTISFKVPLKQSTIRRQMTNLFNELKQNYCTSTMYWISEFHSDMNRFHSHCLIESSDPINTKKFIDRYWNRHYGSPLTVPYDDEFNRSQNSKYKTGSGCPFYCTKFINNRRLDWDICV